MTILFQGPVRLLGKMKRRMEPQKPFTASLFEQLPVEIKLRIFSHLSLWELTQARALNSYFRQLIESKENRISFNPEELSHSSVNRLERFVADNIEFNNRIPLIEAFTRFFLNRGIWLDNAMFYRDIHNFCDHWYARFEDPVSIEESDLYFNIWHEIHNHLVPALDRAVNKESLQSFLNEHARTMTCDCWARSLWYRYRAWVMRWMRREVAKIHGVPADWHIHTPDDDLLGRPLTPVTCLHNSDPELKDRARGVCSVYQLCVSLNVRRVPEEIFAFYVRTEWAYEKVKRYFAGNWKEDVRKREDDLTRDEKARIMREMFIC